MEVARMVASIARPSTGKIHQLAKSVLQERNDNRYREPVHFLEAPPGRHTVSICVKVLSPASCPALFHLLA